MLASEAGSVVLRLSSEGLSMITGGRVLEDNFRHMCSETVIFEREGSGSRDVYELWLRPRMSCVPVQQGGSDASWEPLRRIVSVLLGLARLPTHMLIARRI